MVVNRQIGDYVIYSNKENVAPFFVRMAGASDDNPISYHKNITEAVKVVLNYQNADKRRK